MGDKATLAKARRELEELYLGVPDESVNLTFGDLAEVKQLSEKKKHTNMDPISETKPKEGLAPLKKLPSLDFNRALQGSKSSHDHHHHHHGHHAHVDSSVDSISHSHRHHGGEDLRASRGGHHSVNGENHRGHAIAPNSHHHSAGFRHGMESSMAFDDVSGISMSSMHPIPERGGGRRRPGIPHSNICTICTTYIYIFRHRCLVCGRVYCRNCVNIGMGEMSEGRKCVECLGRRFSQRYIQRAGKIGCCARYPSLVKQQELKWAEKGPRRSGERGYGRSVMMSRSRSPVTPRTPAHHGGSTPSFVMSSPYSPYSPTKHALPF